MNEKYSIQVCDSSTISEQTLLHVAKIERDMWAREEGLGEYLVCPCCKKTYSKKQIFGHLSTEIFQKTVCDIEALLGVPNQQCSFCDTLLEEAYPVPTLLADHIYRTKLRSHLVLLIDQNKEIQGFMSGYQDSFEALYERELYQHFGELGVLGLRRILEQKIGANIPDYIFNGCSVGTTHSAMSFANLYKILQGYFLSMPALDDDVFGIFELDVRSNLYAIFYALGLQKLGVKEFIEHKNPYYQSDIFYQTGFVRNSKKELQVPMRDFLKKYLHIMKEAN